MIEKIKMENGKVILRVETTDKLVQDNDKGGITPLVGDYVIVTLRERGERKYGVAIEYEQNKETDIIIERMFEVIKILYEKMENDREIRRDR